MKKSRNKNKTRLALARLHEVISNQRNDFLHKLSRTLANEYSFMAVEKLQVSTMLHNNYSSLSKHISDVSWNQFILMLSYKAESAGGKVVCVDPRGTSQECSSCGKIVGKSLAVRLHSCPYCGLSTTRDRNAAMNIFKRAMTTYNQTTAGPAGSQACAISSKGNATPSHSAETVGRDRANTLSHKDKASMVCEAGTIRDAA